MNAVYKFLNVIIHNLSVLYVDFVYAIFAVVHFVQTSRKVNILKILHRMKTIDDTIHVLQIMQNSINVKVH